MNVLDRAINFVAPRYGLRRTQARMALELTEGYLERHASRFSYDGASAGRRAYGWYAPSSDANVELRRVFGRWLSDETLGLSGRVDLILIREEIGEAVVVDYKLTTFRRKNERSGAMFTEVGVGR